MLKKHFSMPPTGWNSYDYYDTNVTENDVLRNAEWMRDHLLPYGWEYVIVDIQWYAPDTATMRDRFQYIPFSKLNMDQYGRLQPDPVKFPSSADGKGFKPLADQIHAMGLKFGIHIMRGIPRAAAHDHMPVLGAKETADMIADPSSICGWNGDMYGVCDTADGQAWYDSLALLYDSWGVDFIKCDDICNTNMYADQFRAGHEIRMLYNALEKVPRDIVLSLSPGPALPEKRDIYASCANMWRITDDFWDRWDLLKDMFSRCRTWAPYVREGCYPDCDMLPMGRVGKMFNAEHEDRPSGFTMDEQQTMMSLWCMFRSPLMLGAEMPLLDNDTIALLTNSDVLSLRKEGHTPRLITMDDSKAIWCNEGEGVKVIELTNLSDESCTISLPEAETDGFSAVKELWSGKQMTIVEAGLESIPAHGTRLYKLI